MPFTSGLSLRRSASTIFLGIFLAVASFAQGKDKDLKPVDDRRKELKQLIADEWEYEMR